MIGQNVHTHILNNHTMVQFTGNINSADSTLVCVQKLSLVKLTCKALLRLTNAITEHTSRT